WAYRNIIGNFQLEKGSFQVIETGPIRTIYQSVFAFKNSRIVMNTIAYSQFPALEYRLRIHWNEERRRLKLSIPTGFKKDHLICEVPGGIISRPADGEEYVHGRWFKLEGDDGAAIGIVNSGQLGLDFKDGEVRLSVLRSAAYCHERDYRLEKYPARKFMDQGVHEVRLLVTAGDAESVRKSLPSLVNWLNAPPIVYAHLPVGSSQIGKNNGTSNQSSVELKNLMSIEPENISLLACKRSWDGEALIVRLQEGSGMKTEALVKFSLPAIERRILFQPLEIKTLRLEKSGRLTEVDLIAEY
ncbi:MAG TPA: glycoside hydrolase family 38 C-terminal domain-containing protein, partial [bacterium]